MDEEEVRNALMQSIAAEVIYIWVQKQHIVISTSEIAEKALIKIKLKLFFPLHQSLVQ